MDRKSWDDRMADLFERIIALQATGGDTRALREEMKRLLEEPKDEPNEPTKS